MLGLTIGCARCHDHKYDPIPSRDYYRFAAVFTTAIRNDIDFSVAPDEDDAAQKAYDARHDAAEKARDDYAAGPMRQALIKWLANPANRAAARGAWLLPTIVSANSSGGATFKPQDDGSLLAEGPNAKDEHYTFVVTTPLKSIAELRIEALTDPSMVKGGPGRASNGNFALSDLKVSVKQLGGDQKPVAVKLTRARATHEQNQTGLSVASSLDDNPKTGWAVDFGGIGKPQAAVFDFEKPITFDDGAELTIEMDFRVNTSHNIGRPRLSVSGTTDAPVAVGDAGPPAEVAAALKQIDEGVTLDTLPDASREVLLAWFAPRDAQWSKLNAAVLECEKSAPKSHNEKIQITSEGLKPVKHHADDRGFPHFYPQTYLLKRGDVNQKTEVVEAGYLQVLERDGLDANHWRIAPPAGARTSYRRASLANWMTDVDHGAGHLAARVIVNRLWQHHLGRGIVATPNDFGVQGDRPTHPQLLEFLASDLIEHGWKLKRLQKLIMTSAVYMQSADSDSQRTQIDPTNLYLWRWSPRRLEAEAIRDTMLSVAGTLNSAMYGQGTLDENMTRRSVYFTIKRSKLIPTMMLFDWPEHLVSIGARASTTIAPQALMFMNSPQARTYATDFAQRVTKMSGDDAIGNAYRLAFNREPSKVERADAQAFINQQIASYQATKKADAPRLAMIDFCQALMGLNEFLYME
ncbi:MAG: DUF1553 domain-containing protein [Planctomycetes bacterium]|nr:DUF1553 domain-containing protein [Planctomycetota bacterium]